MFLGAISLVLIGATFVSAQDPDNPPQIWEKLKDNWPQKQYEEWLYMKVQENNDNHREWLYKPEKCPGYDQNELRFHGKKGTSAIQKLTLGGRRDVQFPGKHSVGVFDVVEPVPKRLRDEANEHVLKVVDISDKSASCEPYALEQFGVWHRTGIRHGQLPNGTEVKFGGIYLRTEPGKDIRADEKWDKASSEQRLAYLKEVQREVRGIVYDHAFGSKERPNTNKAKLVPCDFGPGNVLLETDVREETEEGKTEVVIFPLKTTLIDFGKTGLKRSSKKPAKSDFKAWFNRRFKLLWGYQYVQAGDPKSVYNEFAKWYIEEWQKPVQRLAIEAGPSGEAGGETGEADSKQKKQKKKKRDPKGKGKRQ